MVTDGVILLDKPAGVTSHDVVVDVRKRINDRSVKVGHAGTLDPFATGLLLILCGKATRLQPYLMPLPKQYTVVAQLGQRSTTGDPEGEISSGVMPPDQLHLPTGDVWQRPPAYSALKVKGKRAYALAREGKPVELPERLIHVFRFEQLWREDDRAEFLIECSSGTYVRSLIADLHDAYCVTLRRTAIGPFQVEDADPTRILDLNEALSFLPALQLDAREAQAAAHGRAVAGKADGPVRLVDADGLIAIAHPQDGLLQPKVGLRS